MASNVETGGPTSAVLFDFFGTLVDYSPSWTAQGYRKAHEVLVPMGCTSSYDEWLATWDSVFADLVADAEATGIEFSMHDAFAAFASATDLPPCAADDVDRFLHTYLGEWSEDVRLIAGVPPMLDRLRAAGHRLGLVTNTHNAALVRGHLDEMELTHRFDVVVTSVELGYRKPRAEIFEAALGELGVEPTEAAFVGDTHDADFIGPEQLGLRGYLIVPQDRPPPPDVPVERVLRSVLEVEPLVF